MLEFGDLIFILKSNYSTGDWLTDLRQGFRRADIDGRYITVSHVAIATGNGHKIFHAVSRGVKFSNIFRYICKKNGRIKENILVYRNTDLKAVLGNNFNAVQAAGNFFKKYYGQKYNWSVIFEGKEKPVAKFCSELAAALMHEYKVLKTGKKAENILPLDLLEICISTGNWQRIVTEFTNCFDPVAIAKRFDAMIEQQTDDTLKDFIATNKTNTISLAKTSIKNEKVMADADNTTYGITKSLKDALGGGDLAKYL